MGGKLLAAAERVGMPRDRLSMAERVAMAGASHGRGTTVGDRNDRRRREAVQVLDVLRAADRAYNGVCRQGERARTSGASRLHHSPSAAGATAVRRSPKLPAMTKLASPRRFTLDLAGDPGRAGIAPL